MAFEIYPGVYVKFVSASSYVQPMPGTVAFIAFASEKGPDNELILSNGPQYLLDTFGKPDKIKYGEGLYTAYNFNTVSSNLYVMRVLPNDASFSNLIWNYDHATTTFSLNTRTDLYSYDLIDTAIAEPQTMVIFYPIGRGAYYNALSVKLTQNVNDPSTYTLDIYDVDENGASYIRETFVVSLVNGAIDMSGDSIYLPDVLERYSEVLRAVVDDALVQTAINDGITDFSTPFTTTQSFSGGSYGSLYDSTGALDWSVLETLLTEAYSGLIDEQVTDTEFIYFNLILDSGYPAPVKDAIKTLAESIRIDALGLLDMGDNPNAATALSVRNTTYNYNSKYVALYEPYTKIFDVFNSRYIWISPIYHVAKNFALTDRNYEIWYPVAGLNRGMVDTYQLRYELRGGYKEQFILNQINPIVHLSQGYVIWNESTSLKEPSPFENIHIVRLVFKIYTDLKRQLRWYIWDLQENYNVIRNTVMEYLTSISDAFASSPNVRVYSTEYDRKRGVVRVDVFLQPKGAIKIIKLSLIVS